MIDYVLEALEKGGWVLLPIFLTSLIGWFLMLRSWRILKSLRPRGRRTWKRRLQYPRALLKWINQLTPRDKASMPGHILQRVYASRNHGRKVMLEVYEEELKHYIPEMEKGMNTIGVLAGVAPLLGLLGTVSGMVATFDVISVFGAGNPALMADSIGEALVTTQNGLLAALPLMMGHILLLNQSNQLENETEKAVHLLIHIAENDSPEGDESVEVF